MQKLNDLDSNGQNIIENSEKHLFDLAEKGSFNSSLIQFDDAMKQTIEKWLQRHIKMKEELLEFQQDLEI